MNTLIVSVAIASFAVASGAQAALIDLTTAGDSATINGALFETSDPNTGAGSGNIDSFLRTQNSPSEFGFNTDGALTLDQKSGPFTRLYNSVNLPY